MQGWYTPVGVRGGAPEEPHELAANGRGAAHREAVLFNSLFAGSEGGAQTAATWFCLIGSCMVNAIDPWLYLNDVLPKLNDWPAKRVLELERAAWRARRLSDAG